MGKTRLINANKLLKKVQRLYDSGYDGCEDIYGVTKEQIKKAKTVPAITKKQLKKFFEHEIEKHHGLHNLSDEEEQEIYIIETMRDKLMKKIEDEKDEELEI